MDSVFHLGARRQARENAASTHPATPRAVGGDQRPLSLAFEDCLPEALESCSDLNSQYLLFVSSKSLVPVGGSGRPLFVSASSPWPRLPWSSAVVHHSHFCPLPWAPSTSIDHYLLFWLLFESFLFFFFSFFKATASDYETTYTFCRKQGKCRKV